MNSPKKFRVCLVKENRYQPFQVLTSTNIDGKIDNVEWDWDWEYYSKSADTECECIIEQFVGLTDNHGVEIYEGDLVQKYIISENHLGEKIASTNNLPPYEVKWQQQHCGFGIATGNRHFYVVVGNIHEKK